MHELTPEEKRFLELRHEARDEKKVKLAKLFCWLCLAGFLVVVLWIAFQ